MTTSERYSGPALFFLAVLLVSSSPSSTAEEPVASCESTVGNCRVNAFYDFRSYTETEVMVTAVGADPFLTTLLYPGDRSLTVGWQRPSSAGTECEEVVQCENGEVIDCFREGPCWSGHSSFSVHCGMYLPVRRPWMPDPSLEATVKTCRGLADPWPDTPAPQPSPQPKPKPKPKGKGKPGPGGGGGEDPPAGACDRQQIVDANTTLIDYHETIHVKTTHRRPGSSLPGNFDSEITVRHEAPSDTHVVAVVQTDKGPEHHEVVHLGNTMYWKSPQGAWEEMDRDRMAGSPMQPPDPAVGEHDKYGPRGFVQGIEPGNFAFVGTGPCEGVLDQDTCHAFRFSDDGHDNTAYFSVGSCRLRSVIGANQEGPRTLVITYGDQTVERPSGEILTLTGDPSKDMPIMMRLMGQPGPR